MKKRKYIIIWVIFFITIFIVCVLLLTNFSSLGNPPLLMKDILDGGLLFIFIFFSLIGATIITMQFYFDSLDEKDDKKDDEKDK